MAAEKLQTDGGEGLVQNPFAKLTTAGLPAVPPSPLRSVAVGTALDGKSRVAGSSAPAERNRGRVDIVRQTGGRGGKTVTVISGFIGIGLPEKELLAKKIRNSCGCGGTVKDGAIEIQGDQRENIAEILKAAGFRPVFAGG